ncbi:MAG: hypothetical protein WKG03_10380, partial [Telluria sp.]
MVGVIVLVSLAAAAKLPRKDLNPQEMAERFRFESTTLDFPTAVVKRETRDVHRSLQKIQPWIASVGAAAAMGDIDGDLKPDDACLVDTRTNEVRVAPLLDRKFASFVLTPPPGNEPAAT